MEREFVALTIKQVPTAAKVQELDVDIGKTRAPLVREQKESNLGVWQLKLQVAMSTARTRTQRAYRCSASHSELSSSVGTALRFLHIAVIKIRIGRLRFNPFCRGAIGGDASSVYEARLLVVPQRSRNCRC